MTDAGLDAPGTRRAVVDTVRAWDAVETAAVVIVGAGVAGLTAALGLAPRRVVVLSKTRLGDGGASVLAQGGIAAAVGPADSAGDHATDTLAAGVGLSDPAVVELLAGDGPAAVRQLIRRGARFDRDGAGRLALGREAAHGRARIVHARDATGAEMVRALVAAVRSAAHVRVCDETLAADLFVSEGRVRGVVAWHPDGRTVLHLAPAVVLATGGIGRVYRHTTNPREATGDGLAMAARAGARLVDLEFVQFHPTALDAGADPLPLLTEALRGEGATLVDDSGRRFVADVHPLAELAPRDVVARAIWRREAGGHAVFLDARSLGPRLPSRFPTVFAACRARGLDPRRDLLPVTPAAHYHMGGVDVDPGGRTSLPGLWACGEVAATGVHGANRLASNSLLEALVFGRRVADDIRRAADAPVSPTLPATREGGDARSVPGRMPAAGDGGGSDPAPDGRAPRRSAAAGALVRSGASGALTPEAVEAEVRDLMWRHAGLERDRSGLTSLLDRVTAVGPDIPDTQGWATARNLATIARLVAAAALTRAESRGAHFRLDHAATDPRWRRRLYVTAPGGAFQALVIRRGRHLPLPARTPADRRPAVAEIAA